MKRILNFGQRCGLHRRELSQLANEAKSSNAESDLVIPNRIPRTPTDILRALASTIHKDPTAPNFKYHDDPYLIPISNVDKRSFALSKESGKNAAKYFLKNFPECFINNPADPNIEAFNAPRKAFEPNQENTEEDLLFCLEEYNVEESLIVYNNLQNKGTDVAEETLLKLLQLIGYYNATPPADVSLTEENYFHRHYVPTRNSWKAGGVAEKIFERIANKDARVHSALVQGMLKYFDADRGYHLYNEMRSQNMIPSGHVFNYLISCVPRLKEGSSARLEFLSSIFEQMKSDNVAPTLITFNNALQVCSRLHYTDGSKYCVKILAEMKFLKIEPSLASYAFVLETMYRKRAPLTKVVYDIMEKVDEHDFEVRDPRDIQFLGTAMAVAQEYLMDKELGYQLVDIAEKHQHLLTHSYSESVFYQKFFKLLCETEDFDKFMIAYNRLTPNTYSPEPAVLSDILSAIEMHSAFIHLPQLWSDIISFRQVEREQLLKQVLALTASVERGESVESQSLQQQCEVIARDIQTRIKQINEDREKIFRLPVQLDAEMISDMMQTYLNGDNLEFAAETLTYLVENQQNIPGVARAAVMMQLATKACEAKELKVALACARYCGEIGHEAIVEKIREQAVQRDFGEEFLRRIEKGDPEAMIDEEK